VGVPLNADLLHEQYLRLGSALLRNSSSNLTNAALTMKDGIAT
jgi:hypothetical protein